MLTVIIKRTDEPKVIQMTQSDLVKQLDSIQGAEILLADTWLEGLYKVRTPYVSLVEPDCTLSANYYSSNFGLMHKNVPGGKGSGRGVGGGGYTKMAMLSSCIGLNTFANRVYSYELRKTPIKDFGTNVTSDGKEIEAEAWHILPQTNKVGSKPYHVQVGFVPGAIIRMSSLKEISDDELWLDEDLVKLSTALSFYFWDTGRRVQSNPNTTYVSTNSRLSNPPQFQPSVTMKVGNIFRREGIGLGF